MSESDTWTSPGDSSRRQRILAAARELVVQLGYDKAGLREITARAGLSKSAVYLDFESKEALVDALIREESISFATRLFRDLETGADALGFGVMFARTIALLDEHPFLRALLGDDAALLGGYLRRNRSAFLSARHSLNRLMLDLLERRGALRRDVDPDAAASLLMVLTVGFIEAPRETTGDGTGTLLEEMGRMLDRWLIDDDRTRGLRRGDLVSILEQVLRAGGEGAS